MAPVQLTACVHC